MATIVRTMGEQTHPAAHAPADLNAVARAALALAGGEGDLEPLPPVTCDPGEIEQVLVNLLVNAADAGGTVTLRTRAEDGHVRLSVSDTGAGIPRTSPSASSTRSSPPRRSAAGPARGSRSRAGSWSAATAAR